MVNFNINIKKKDLFIIIAAFVFLVGTGIIIAYGGTTPAAVGHSLGEIDASSCTDGQVMIKVGGVWGCGRMKSTSFVTVGTGHDGQTGTQACQSIGKECVAVISQNHYIYDPSFYCKTSAEALYNCMVACERSYTNNLPGIGDGIGSDIHSCDAKVGEFTTHMQANVVSCHAYFHAICS